MRKATCILLLAAICVCVISLPLLAQSPTTNWPKFQRDSHNSGRSPATTIAVPYVQANISLGGYFTRGNFAIDPDGYIYAVTSSSGTHSAKFSSDLSTSIWNVTEPNLFDTLTIRNGPTLFDDGNGNKYVLLGPGTGTPGTLNTTDGTVTGPATGQDNKKLFALNPTDGTVVWSTDLLPYYPSADVNYSSPTVGPDGTIYTHLQNSAYDSNITLTKRGASPLFGSDPTGPIIAIDPVTHNVKWTFGSDNHHGIGNCWGTFAWKVVNGRTRLFVAGECDAANQSDNDNVMAIDDYGDHAELVWGANAYMHDGPVSLSNDGNTVYVGCADTWRDISSSVTKNDKRVVALDADTGAEKWTINTGSQHLFPPTIGADGTLYVAGISGGTTALSVPVAGKLYSGSTSFMYPFMRSIKGRLTAIKDNGGSASIKWQLNLPDDFWNDCSNVVVTSGNPAVLYVSTGLGPLSSRGRVYAIADMGDHPEILWTYQGIADSNWGCIMALADNGDLYLGHYFSVYRFPSGFNVNNPNGISGYVKDSDGNPIAGAWVAAQPTPHPLADCANRVWTSTNSDGYYHLGVIAAGTWYVAAAASDFRGGVKYEPSDDQVVNLNDVSDVVKVNFTLGEPKYNWASSGTANSDAINNSYPPANAIDGSYSTYFQLGAQPKSGSPYSLFIDLGTPRNISEALIYWDKGTPVKYYVEYSDDNVTWNTVYTSPQSGGSTNIKQNTGFPLDWYTSEATLAQGYGMIGVSCDVVKFDPTIAQYWRIYITLGQVVYYPMVRELELRDATMVTHNNVKTIKTGQDGDPVGIGNAIITGIAGGGIPSNTIFVESSDRTTGLSVTSTSDLSGIGFGDQVAIAGTIATDSNGDKCITNATVTRNTSVAPIEALGMNNRDASKDNARNLFVKIWGKVSAVDTDNFTISDGSSDAVKVFCGNSMSKPSVGDVVRVRGIASKDSSGPVLYMRNESADWTLADAAYQALPFAGAYKYPQEYLVLGPFTDSSSTVSSEWIDPGLHDFISVATNGANTEAAISQPKAGDILAGKTWVKAYATNGILDINSALGGVYASSVAYVYLNVWSEIDNPAVELATGSNDWLYVYVNGNAFRSVDYSDPEHGVIIDSGRACNYGDDYDIYETVPLHKGSNDILFKVVNKADTFSLTSQFVPASTSGTFGWGQYPAYTTTGLGYIRNTAE